MIIFLGFWQGAPLKEPSFFQDVSCINSKELLIYLNYFENITFLYKWCKNYSYNYDLASLLHIKSNKHWYGINKFTTIARTKLIWTRRPSKKRINNLKHQNIIKFFKHTKTLNKTRNYTPSPRQWTRNCHLSYSISHT